jgi:hypothetical protein
MAKRVVLKKGDIVSITRDNHKRYIQYVDNDHYQLNGDVIYVFKRIYTSNDNPSVEGIVDDTYELILHTTIRAGIKYNGWEKIGHSEPKDVSFVHFFSWNSDDEKLIFSKCNMFSEFNWRVWTIEREWTKVIFLPSGVCMPGLVYAPLSIEEFLFDNRPLVHRNTVKQIIARGQPIPDIATYKVSTLVSNTPQNSDQRYAEKNEC